MKYIIFSAKIRIDQYFFVVEYLDGNLVDLLLVWIKNDLIS